MTAPEEIAYCWFADAHPISAYRTNPEKFLAYATAKTGATREQIEQAIRDTCAEFPDDPEVVA